MNLKKVSNVVINPLKFKIVDSFMDLNALIAEYLKESRDGEPFQSEYLGKKCIISRKGEIFECNVDGEVEQVSDSESVAPWFRNKIAGVQLSDSDIGRLLNLGFITEQPDGSYVHKTSGKTYRFSDDVITIDRLAPMQIGDSNYVNSINRLLYDNEIGGVRLHPAAISDSFSVAYNLPSLELQDLNLALVKAKAEVLNINPNFFGWGISEDGIISLMYRGQLVATPEVNSEGVLTYKKGDPSNFAKPYLECLPEFSTYQNESGVLLSEASDLLKAGVSKAEESRFKFVEGLRVPCCVICDSDRITLLFNGVTAYSSSKNDTDALVNSVCCNSVYDCVQFSTVTRQLRIKDAVEIAQIQTILPVEGVISGLLELCKMLIEHTKFCQIHSYSMKGHPVRETISKFLRYGQDNFSGQYMSRIKQLGGSVLPLLGSTKSLYEYPLSSLGLCGVLTAVLGSMVAIRVAAKNLYDMVIQGDPVTAAILLKQLEAVDSDILECNRLIEAVKVC